MQIQKYIQTFLSILINTFKRFPIPSIIAIVFCVFNIYHFDNFIEYGSKYNTEEIFSLSLFIFFPIFISLKLIYEKNNNKKQNILFHDIAFILLILFTYFKKGDKFDIFGLDIYSIILILISYLSITFAPFIKNIKNNSVNFLHYNYGILKAALKTFIYSFSISIGFIILIISIDYLLTINLKDVFYNTYSVFLYKICIIFFFLSNFPKNEYLYTDKNDFDYKIEMKGFFYYILIPFLSLYALILYIYGFKILIEMTLPEGMVSAMIIGFSIILILTYITIYENIIHKNYSKK